MTILPPNSTTMERAIEGANGAALEGVPAPIRNVWDPATCPAQLLPFLAWGVSIDFWDTNWTEGQKRGAIASAIEDQRRKGTPASLRAVLDRFDPAIALVEWFEDRGSLDPHEFRIELPLAADTAVAYDEALVLSLLRDIAAIKPLRAHMLAVHRLAAEANGYLAGGVLNAGFVRLEGLGDLDTPNDPVWATYLQTEIGEPMQDSAGEILEHS